MSTVAAWDAFQAGSEPTGVRTEVLASWRRSRWSGVDPGLDVPPVDAADGDSPFIRAAAPVLLRMADLLSDSRTCLALADREGHVVWRWVSDRALSAECDRYGMQFGSSFDEERVGTCGIGTALETGRMATVVGTEHFVESFHRWACVAVPVVSPVNGRTVGAVNVTTRATDAGPFLQVAALTLADGVVADVVPVSPGSLRDGAVLVLHARPGTSCPSPAPASAGGGRLTPLEQAECDVIAATLAECGGNKSATAARLGISRGTLYQKLRRYRPLTA